MIDFGNSISIVKKCNLLLISRTRDRRMLAVDEQYLKKGCCGSLFMRNYFRRPGCKKDHNRIKMGLKAICPGPKTRKSRQGIYPYLLRDLTIDSYLVTVTDLRILSWGLSGSRRIFVSEPWSGALRFLIQAGEAGFPKKSSQSPSEEMDNNAFRIRAIKVDFKASLLYLRMLEIGSWPCAGLKERFHGQLQGCTSYEICLKESG